MHCKQPIHYPPNVLLESCQKAYIAKVAEFAPVFKVLKLSIVKFRSANYQRLLEFLLHHDLLKKKKKILPVRLHHTRGGKKIRFSASEIKSRIGHHRKDIQFFSSLYIWMHQTTL